MGMSKSISTRAVQLKRPPPLLVCRKCLKRSGDGKAIKRALKDRLKEDAKAASRTSGGKIAVKRDTKKTVSGRKKSRPAKLVLTSCFGVCPKNAVVTATAEQLVRGEVSIVGTGAIPARKS